MQLNGPVLASESSTFARTVWGWLGQFPERNGDRGPWEQFPEQFRHVCLHHRVYIVVRGLPDDQRVVGMIVVETAGRSASIHICFDRAVHGTGIAGKALRRVIGYLRDAGVETITATPFADNEQARRFFLKAGFKDLGIVPNVTVDRGGARVQLRSMVKTEG